MTKVSNQVLTPEAVISSVFMDLRNGRFVDASAHFAETFRFTDHGVGLEFKDRAQLTEFFYKVREFYPDSLRIVDRVITSGDHVIAEWTDRATLTEPFFGGLSRKVPVLLKGASIVETHEGAITDWADYYDGLTSKRTRLAAHFQEWVEL